MIGLQIKDRVRSDVWCTSPAVPCSRCKMASLEPPRLFVLDLGAQSGHHRSNAQENPRLSSSGSCASLLFFRAITIRCNSYLLYKCPVPSCSWAAAEIATECSGLARLLNIVNERRSRIKEVLMRLFVLDNCADVYLSFSSPYLALNWLFESAPRPKKEKNVLMVISVFLIA